MLGPLVMRLREVLDRRIHRLLHSAAGKGGKPHGWNVFCAIQGSTSGNGRIPSTSGTPGSKQRLQRAS